MDISDFGVEHLSPHSEATEVERTNPVFDRIGPRSSDVYLTENGVPVFESNELVVMSSHDYLGLARDERVRKAAESALEVVGSTTAAPRRSGGETVLHHDLERQLSSTLGVDRSLTVASYFEAYYDVVSILQPDRIFVDEHSTWPIASTIGSVNTHVLRYDHGDVDDLSRIVSEIDSSRAGEESWLFVTDSVFQSDGSIAPISDIADLVREHDGCLLVDESHAIGLHADGAGIVAAEGLSQVVDIQIGSLSTTLASQGGFIGSSESVIRYIRQHAPAITRSHGLNPPSTAIAAEALHISRFAPIRDRLWENVEYLREGLQSIGYSILGETQILPVQIESSEDPLVVSDVFRSRGISTATGLSIDSDAPLDRIWLLPQAGHSKDDLKFCIDTFEDLEIGAA